MPMCVTARVFVSIILRKLCMYVYVYEQVCGCASTRVIAQIHDSALTRCVGWGIQYIRATECTCIGA
jgi:predicted nucleic acid-binding Zn ribbon protein